MSEWSDSQAKQKQTPSIDEIRKRLAQGRQGRTRRKLSTDERTKAKRLRELIKAARASEFIANKTLKRWLSDEQFNSIAQRWLDEQQRREQWSEKPSVIVEYEDRVRKALFVYNRAEGYSLRRNHKTAKKLFGEADTLFERALEYLQEFIHPYPHLTVWFDRNTEWSIDGEAGLSPDEIPRVITSRSLLNRSGGAWTSTMTKADIKRQILEEALDELIYEAPSSSSSVRNGPSKLDQLLKDLNDED